MAATFCAGDDIAIVPAADSHPDQTLEVVRVDFANEFLVRLIDGRVYSLLANKGVTPNTPGFIQLATDAHRAAIRQS